MDRALAHPRRDQRLDDADQGAHRHAVDRRADAGRDQGLRPRPGGDRADRRARSRRSLREVPGTRSVFAERAAGGYFLDFEPRREQLARYGLTRRGGADGHRRGDRRRERHHHDRGPRSATRSTCATRASCATTSTGSARVLVPTLRRRAGAARPARRHPARPGPGDDPQRERLPRRLRLRRRRRPRHRRLRRRGQGGRARERSTLPAGLRRSSGAASTRT